MRPAPESAMNVGFDCLGHQHWFLAREACKLWGVVGQYDNFPWTWDGRVVIDVACPSVGKFIACCRRALEGAEG